MGLVAIGLIYAFVSIAFGCLIREREERASDALLASFVVASSVFAVVLYGLGLVHRMRPVTVSLCAITLALGALALARVGRAKLKASARTFADWLVLPLRALWDGGRERSLVVFLMPLTILFAGWMLAQAWLLPPWRGADTLAIHEPLIGFAVQTGGLGGAVGTSSNQLLDARPQLGELWMAWVASMSDHRFIDVPSVLAIAPLMLAVVSLTRRMSADTTQAAAWGVALLFVPAMALAVQTTRVDLLGTTYLLSAASFAARPVRTREAWLACASCSLAILTLPQACVPSLVLAGTVLARALVAFRWTAVASTLPVLASLGAVYGRNAARFGRPVVGALIAELGIRRPPIAKVTDLLGNVVSAPYSGPIRSTSDYGAMVGWIVAPLSVIALGAVLFVAIKAVVGAIAKRPAWTQSERATGAMIVAAALLTALTSSADFASPRANLGAIGLACALVAWVGSSWPRLAREVATAAALVSLVSFVWHVTWWASSQTIVLTSSELLAVSRVPSGEREILLAAHIHPALPREIASPLEEGQARIREKTIAPGSVVAFTGDATGAVFALWNFRYENRVVYVPEGDAFVARAKATGASWLYVPAGSTMRAALPKSGFVEMGPLVQGEAGTIFRRAEW